METTCPHCSQSIEIDSETLGTLQRSSHFNCPACSGAVPVPGMQVNQQSVLNPAVPERIINHHRMAMPRAVGKASKATLARTHRGMNRNLLILGSITLLTLGGVAIFLATRNEGNTFNSKQNINNEIIHNSYFTNLIASGVTTEKDLEAVTDIRPYEDGFIGITNEPMAFQQAKGLANRTGATILNMGDIPTGFRQPFLGWLTMSYKSHLSSTVWVRDRNEAGVLDGADFLPITALDGSRKAFLQWGFTQKVETLSGQVAGEASTTGSGGINFKPDQNREDAIAVIKQLGGKYEEGPNTLGKPITKIHLPGTSADAASLRHFSGLHNLEGIDLNACPVGDAGLAEIRGKKSLQYLHLWGSGPITDQGFEYLKDLTNLTTLNVGYSGIEIITGSGLRHLKGMSNLRVLGLNVLKNLRNENLMYLSDLTSLENLGLGYCPLITDEGLKHIAHLPKLLELDLRDTLVTDSGLRLLVGAKQLRNIFLKGSKVTESGLAELQKVLPDLKIDPVP